MTLSVLPGRYAICRLSSLDQIPDWAVRGDFFSITKTKDELSIVAPETSVPADIRSNKGWKALRLAGPVEFSEVGVLSALTKPLADANVSVYAVSTFDTDYLFVKNEMLDHAVRALTANGHSVSQ